MSFLKTRRTCDMMTTSNQRLSTNFNCFTVSWPSIYPTYDCTLREDFVGILVTHGILISQSCKHSQLTADVFSLIWLSEPNFPALLGINNKARTKLIVEPDQWYALPTTGPA